MSKYEPLGKDLFAELFVIACKEGELELNTSREETDHLYDQTFYHWFESNEYEESPFKYEDGERVSYWELMAQNIMEHPRLAALSENQAGREITPDQARVLALIAVFAVKRS